MNMQAPTSAPMAATCENFTIPVTERPVKSKFLADVTYFVPSATEYCFANGTSNYGCLNITDLRYSTQTP